MTHRLGVQVGGIWRGVGVAGRRRALFHCTSCTYWLLYSSDRHDVALHEAEDKFCYFIAAIVNGSRGARSGPPLEDASKAGIREWNRWRWFLSTDSLFTFVFLHSINNA